MFNLKSKVSAVLVALCCAGTALAQDSGPLIDLLVRKGIVNDQEAEDLRADLSRDAAAGIISTISGGKSTVGLSIAGRIQVQYVGLGTDISGTTADPVDNNHFFLRRIYIGMKANLGAGWSSSINYDFAGSTFDEAKITWAKSDAFNLDVGFRKVPFGLEEWYTSSGSLKAIERSPATRYWVEGNNGRRLGAGSYRIGVYAGGKAESGLFYNVALTNPERDESAAGVAGTGSAANNNLSYWGNLGFKGKMGEGASYILSGSIGLLPDQGGKTLGAGNDLTVYNAFAQIDRGPLQLLLEYFGSQNDKGASATLDSESSAFMAEASYLMGNIEYVARYTTVDSDGRGLTTGDLIRSAPAGGTMDKLNEWYLGLNYYFRGNDVKWQVGYIFGQSKDTVTGAAAKASTSGIRSQLQVNF